MISQNYLGSNKYSGLHLGFYFTIGTHTISMQSFTWPWFIMGGEMEGKKGRKKEGRSKRNRVLGWNLSLQGSFTSGLTWTSFIPAAGVMAHVHSSVCYGSLLEMDKDVIGAHYISLSVPRWCQNSRFEIKTGISISHIAYTVSDNETYIIYR